MRFYGRVAALLCSSISVSTTASDKKRLGIMSGVWGLELGFGFSGFGFRVQRQGLAFQVSGLGCGA